MEETTSLSPILVKYMDAYEKNPSSRVFAPLAEVYRKSGFIEKALDILKKGVRVHPTYVLGYLGLANCYFDLGEYSQCYTTLKPFIDQNRDNLILQKLFAKTCLELEYLEEALDTYKYLLFINPKDKEVASSVKELEDQISGETYFKNNPEKLESSKPQLFKEEKLGSNIQSESCNDIDEWIQVDLGNKDEEIEDFGDEEWSMESLSGKDREQVDENANPHGISSELEDFNDSAPDITFTLVDLYSAQGLHDKALEIVDKILEANPEYGPAHIKRNDIFKHIQLTEKEDISIVPKEFNVDEENISLESEVFSSDVEDLSSVTGSFKGNKLNSIEENVKDNEDSFQDLKKVNDDVIESNLDERKFIRISRMEKFLARIKDKANSRL